MPPPLLHLQDIHLTFGTTPLLDGAELAVSAGDRVCLVGRNGSGKSTLLRIAAGLVQADSGRRFVQPGATVRYLPQEPDFAGHATTLDYVQSGFADAAGDHHRAAYLLEQLGLTGAEDPATLSGGEARRAALARVLAPEPDILLLDEPTNHLDLPGIEWLERELGALRSGLVLISHDRRLLEKLSRTTVWLDRGITRASERGFAHFEAWRDEVFEQEELERHKLGRKIAMEEDWLRYGVTARRKRNVRRLADLHALRKKRKEQRGPQGGVRMTASEADLSGRLVIVAEDVSKSFGDRTVVAGVSTRIMRGDRVGIVGPNGAGKTTLLNLLTGQLAPDSGEVRLGTNLEIVTLDQRRDSLDPSQTLVQALAEGGGDTVRVGGQVRHVMSYLKDFLFTPEQANTPVGVLSGGERGRVTLARAFATPSNLMVLDEPTNDLDLETLELLQERLAEYQGTVLLVSHDRDFLDRVVTSVVASEGDGRWVEYAGGYSDMLAQRGASRPAAAARPRQADAKPAAGEAKPRPASAVRRMTFKDKHALETLPARIAALEAEVAALNGELANPDLYARNPARFATATQALEAAQAALSAAEEQWLTLEMLREELGGLPPRARFGPSSGWACAGGPRRVAVNAVVV
ncbi:MAG: ABC-F family ATP-binding cassette domain-containing protein, partial [Acetobacteraceae bacterium]